MRSGFLTAHYAIALVAARLSGEPVMKALARVKSPAHWLRTG